MGFCCFSEVKWGCRGGTGASGVREGFWVLEKGLELIELGDGGDLVGKWGFAALNQVLACLEQFKGF